MHLTGAAVPRWAGNIGFPLRSKVGEAILFLANWGLGRPLSVQHSVTVKFDVDGPVELDGLVEGFSALSSQYKRTLADHGYEGEKTNVRLYVTRISDGCVEAELTVYALLFAHVIQAMDYANIISDFTHKMGKLVGRLGNKNADTSGLSVQDLRDVDKFLDTVAEHPNPQISLRKARYIEENGERRKEIEFEYDFDSDTVINASKSAKKALASLKDREQHKIRRNVLLVWHQTNRDRAKSSGRTGDKAIIQSISDKPRPVFFPVGANSIKHEMTHTEENPLYGRGYMVDVDVEYFDEDPKAYTVMELHGPVDLDDDEDS